MQAGKKVALVVIDHPLHGERGFALSGSMATVTTSDHPTPYLNLSYLTVARDNLKQSVADLLGLRLLLCGHGPGLWQRRRPYHAPRRNDRRGLVSAWRVGL